MAKYLVTRGQSKITNKTDFSPFKSLKPISKPLSGLPPPYAIYKVQFFHTLYRLVGLRLVFTSDGVGVGVVVGGSL